MAKNLIDILDLTNEPDIISMNIDWEDWLSALDKKVTEIGYRKYNQSHKGENFAYWKSFYDDKEEEKKIYQIGILVYDFRQYEKAKGSGFYRISTQYECMLIGDDRIDLIVSKKMPIEDFEVMAKSFYEWHSRQ